jgi:hypothetical protein
MIKVKRLSVLMLIIGIVNTSCYAVKLTKQGDKSMIAISAKSYRNLNSGYGLWITIVNIETHEKFRSKPLTLTSSHSIIQNIPAGKYVVQKIELPIGSLTYVNNSDSVGTFFGVINIEPNSKYYLGNFKGVGTIGRKNVVRIKIVDPAIPESLLTIIDSKKSAWNMGEFIKLYPYKKEELIIY